jgi:hypothetical protein
VGGLLENARFRRRPYESGAGGISIARYDRSAKSLAEELTKYLPKDLDQKLLGSPIKSSQF